MTEPGPPPALPDSPFDREERIRYARHFVLPEVGQEGQRKLRDARVLLIGAGGLGSPAAMYLAAAGVGSIGIIDHDLVDRSNLQRQILHATPDVGRPKVDSGRDRLGALNPHVEVVTHQERLTSANALDLLGPWEIVVDGSDNFPTRYLVNDACVLLGIPDVYGAVAQWEGQVSVFATEGGPCYRCLFREPPPPGLVPSCAEGGVLGVLPGIVGSLQAMEAIKLILGIEGSLAGRLLLFDAMAARFREVQLRRNPDCPVCGDEPTQTGLIDYELFCGLSPAVGANGSPEEIEPKVALARLELGEPERPLLVDVRQPMEWQTGNLERYGARLIPLGELEDRLEEIPRDREILLYCRSGSRSLEAGRRLLAAGFDRVASLSGGILRWSETVEPSGTPR